MRKDDKERIEKIFGECEAIQKGHFVLKSGEHSDTYVEKANLYKNSVLFDELCQKIAQEVFARSINIDAVVGPAPLGTDIASRVAQHLGKMWQKKIICCFTEKDKDDRHIFRRCFHRDLVGKNVLLVDDVLTRGQSIRELIKAVTMLKGRIAAIAVICNRGGLTSGDFYNFPLISLLELKLKSCPVEECSSCKADIPIDSKF